MMFPDPRGAARQEQLKTVTDRWDRLGKGWQTVAARIRPNYTNPERRNRRRSNP
jgi:hypothetical protein